MASQDDSAFPYQRFDEGVIFAQIKGLQGDVKDLQDEKRIIVALAQKNSQDLAVMEKILESLNKGLFGNGRPGIIQELQARAIPPETFTEIKVKVAKHDRLIWVATGAILAMQFLSSSGVISLKALIGVFGHAQ